MQDNPNRSEIDDAFENKAWMEMETILDQEMPVRKRKRRFIWWFFGGCLLVVAGGIFWWLYATYNPVSPEIKPSQIVQQEVSKIAPFNTENQIKTHQPKVTPNTKKDIKEEDKTSVQKAENNKPTINGNALQNPTILSPEVAIQSQIGNATDSVEFSEALVPITQPTESDRPYLSILSHRQQELINISYLPIEPSFLLLPNRDIVFTIPTKPIIKPLTKRWNWGLVGGLGTFKLNRLNEYRVGGFALYELKENWQLRMGLEYEYLRLNLVTDSSDPLASILSNDMGGVAEADASKGAGNTAGDLEDVFNPTQDFSNLDRLTFTGYIQYLKVPLALEYQITSKLQAYLGTNLYFGLSDSYQSLGKEQTRFRRWDISSSAGLNYSLSQKFDMSIGYDLGWFEKRNKLANPSTHLPSLNKAYSPLEGRIQLTTYWRF